MLENKNVLITGSTKGIGRAIADLLLKEKANPIITGRSEPKSSDLGNAAFYKVDFNDISQIAGLRDKLHSENITIDILINNVGSSIVKDFKDMSIEEFDTLNNLNYRSVFATTNTFLSDIIANKGGIVNVLSVAVFDKFKGNSIYSASKSAVATMMNVLREELREEGVDVANLYVGATITDLWHPKLVAKYGHRMMSANDVANATMPVLSAITTSNCTIEELTIRPKKGNV